jgi:cation diffusion facilitator family transporter
MQSANPNGSNDSNDRNSKGMWAGVVSLLTNACLFAFKFFAGTLIGSAAIIGDAFNNLSDAGAGLLTLSGFVNANPDADHPYGFGRKEYIFGLIISFIIFLTAIEVGKNSWHALAAHEVGRLPLPVLLILISTVIVKFALGIYNGQIAKKIDSSVVRGTSADSFTDAALTSITILATVFSPYTSLPLDGIMGLICAVWIFIVACNLLEENANLLLGKKPDPELIATLGEIITSYDYADSFHDIIIHDYGKDTVYASVNIVFADGFDLRNAPQFAKELNERIRRDFKIRLTVQFESTQAIEGQYK